MPELYEREDFIYYQVPVRVFNHCFDGVDIFTPLHWHQNVEFNLTTKGRIMMSIEGSNETMMPGEWCVVNSRELHANHWADIDDHFEGVAVQIAKPFMDRWIGENVRLVRPQVLDAAREIADVLYTFGKYHQQGDTNDLEKMELLFHFLVLVRKYCVDTSAVNKRHDKAVSNVKSIINYIDDHFTEDIDLASVADEFHYTSAHLSRMFRDHIGHNFYQYLQNVRLMHCVEEMKADPDIRLLDCALDNGFPNVKSFIQTFKKSFGCTPSEWMKERGR